MKKNKFYFIFLLIVLFSVVIFFPVLTQRPIVFFVLRTTGESVSAFKAQIFLGHQKISVDPVLMSLKQKKEATEILSKNSVEALEFFSKNFGQWSFVLGISSAEDSWPSYFGRGAKFFFENDSKKYFDNLRWFDRLYLAFNTQSPEPFSFSTPVSQFVGTSKTQNSTIEQTPENTPKPQIHSGVVRVEILNGCGITNAAEWVAKKVKGPGILIVDTRNADNFHYVTTVVRSTTGVPVALEEALERLNFTMDRVEETSNQSSSIDVVIVVGRDFLKLKERKLERSHH